MQLANGYYVWRKQQIGNLTTGTDPVKWNYSITNEYLKIFATGYELENYFTISDEKINPLVKDGFVFIKTKLSVSVTQNNIFVRSCVSSRPVGITVCTDNKCLFCTCNFYKGVFFW
jgi:hypothetical protein